MPTAGSRLTRWASSATTTPSIWYTGDDIVTREPGWGAGNASRLAHARAVRGPRLHQRGRQASSTPASTPDSQYATGLGTQRYDPFENAQCSSAGHLAALPPAAGLGRQRERRARVLVRRLPRQQGRRHRPGHGRAVRRHRGRRPVRRRPAGHSTAPTAPRTRTTAASFITTSGLLPVADYPQFESWAVGRYDRVGGPFEPHSRRPTTSTRRSPTSPTSG